MFLSQLVQAGLPAAVAGTYVGILDEFAFEEQIGNSLVIKEPVGVVGCITPWNYPLHQIVAKVAPALAAGCTVVLKPSEVAPLNAFILADIIDGLGLPAGVFNLVTGTGPVVGEAIAAHPDVDMVSFTGSTRAGKRVSELAAQTVKRVALELGGKSANILLDDLEGEELDKAARAGVGSCYLNSGQTCTAFTRMLVPRAKHDEIVDILRDEVETVYSIGDPFAGEARLGPLISDVQRDRVRGYIQKGVDEGATLVTGGAEQPEDLPKGYYVKPTVFAERRHLDDHRPGGDLRPGAVGHPLRRRGRRGPHRQRLGLRPVRRGVGRRQGAGHGGRPPGPHRPARGQRRQLQRRGALRRLQAVGQRPRARQVRPRGVPPDQVAPALGARGDDQRSSRVVQASIGVKVAVSWRVDHAQAASPSVVVTSTRS